MTQNQNPKSSTPNKFPSNKLGSANQENILNRSRERDLKSSLDVSLDDGVEASESVVAGDIEILLLLDVVLVVLFADRIDSGQDIDNAHLLLLLVIPI